MTAEDLMRSRFTAFARADVDHLERSWAAETRPALVEIDPARRWVGLEIVATQGGRALDATGVVEFRARFEHRGRSGELHEWSRFRREQGRWVYVDGDDASV